MTARDITPPTGKLGVLTPGMGAVASTFTAGVLAARQSGDAPLGSVSQMAHIRLGTRDDNRNPLIRDFVPLASLDDIVFGGWDPISANALEAARTCGVLDERDLAPISAEMEGIIAMDAVFDQRWVSRLNGARVKTETNMWDQAMALMSDIENFRIENDCDRLVMVWCGSTEAFQEPAKSTPPSRRSRTVSRTTTTTSLPARSTFTPHCSPVCRSPTGPPTCRQTCRA